MFNCVLENLRSQAARYIAHANGARAVEQLAPWTKEGQFDNAVFRVSATIPLEWTEVGIVWQGLPFDVEEFFRRLRQEQTGGTA